MMQFKGESLLWTFPQGAVFTQKHEIKNVTLQRSIISSGEQNTDIQDAEDVSLFFPQRTAEWKQPIFK